MANPFPKYNEHAQRAEGKPWEAPHPYIEGVRVLWRDVRLVCTLDHYAGYLSEHPWDPGYGWTAPKAATLWTPDGPSELEKLRELRPGDGRLRDVLWYACGGVQ
jgi:hypothetical protein